MKADGASLLNILIAFGMLCRLQWRDEVIRVLPDIGYCCVCDKE